MARPSKNNADWFGHDHDMRNHRKIKAVRAKFGITGYAIWVMFLEVLTESEENRFSDNELEVELLAGDFGVSVTEIREVIDYCIRLELLFSDNGRIYSKTLDEKLKSVYEKRDLARKSYEKRLESKTTTTPEGVSDTEMTQSKGRVKEEIKKKDIVPADGVQKQNLFDLKANGKGIMICQVLRFECQEYFKSNKAQYDQDMYAEFIEYWSVPNSKDIPRWYKEKTKKDGTWSLPQRLSTWSKNYKPKFNAPPKPLSKIPDRLKVEHV